MKASVAVALVIMGALLIVTPVVSDYLHQSNVAWIMMEGIGKGDTAVTLHGRMSDWYRFGCWLVGTVMILGAIGGSLASRRHPPDA